MRTTLTLDEDVAVQVKRLMTRRRSSLKEVINEALREGLRRLAEPPRRPTAYRTPGVSLGRCLIGGLDDIAEALAVAEGESHRSSSSMRTSSFSRAPLGEPARVASQTTPIAPALASSSIFPPG